MKRFLWSSCCFLLIGALSGQVRYLDEIFPQVERQEDIVYGRNITMLLGTPLEVDLLMDVYIPVGDPAVERPVVIYLHGGWFVPQIYNWDIIGTRRDSSVVETCTRLARMGYTAVAATYRKGWSPLALDMNEEQATLLAAVYRAIQDARTCVRFLRRSHAEEGNPFGVDPERVILWGEESGALISLNAGFLDRYEELLLPAFSDLVTFTPYIQPDIHGDPYGLEPAELNLPNHPGYASYVQMVVGVGGGLLHPSWVDEDQPGYLERPQVVGFHVPTDPYIPYGLEVGLFPRGMPYPLFITHTGSRFVLEAANEKGYNDRLAPILALDHPLTAYVNELQEETWYDIFDPEGYPLATDHLYPFKLSNSRAEKAPWVWWEEDGLEDYILSVVPTYSDPQPLISALEVRYPDMSPDRAKAYIDTIIAYTAPRACASLCLTDCLAALGLESPCLTSLDEPGELGMIRVFPQPAIDQLTVATEDGQKLTGLQLFDLHGRLLRDFGRISRPAFTLERDGLPAGMYFLRIQTAQGKATRKVVWR